MKNSKLVRLLRKLSKEERQRFQVYLQSPYCNPHPRLCNLYEAILKYAPDFEHKKLSKAQLQKQLYGDKSYRDQKIADEISLLYRRLKDFLGLERQKQESLADETDSLQALSEKGLNDLFEIEFRRLEKGLLQRPFLDETYHRQQLALAGARNDHFGRQHLRTQHEGLEKKHQALDQYYLAVKLRESCEALNRQHIINTEIPILLTDVLIQSLSEADHPYRKIPVIDVYFHIYQALAHPESEQHYEQMLDILDMYTSFFAPEESRAMYKYAQNSCIRRINQGAEGFEEKLFALYQTLIGNQLIFFEGELAHTDYKNIVSLALKLGKLDWAHEFLHGFAERLAPTFQENALRYAQAAYLTEKGETKQALSLLNAIGYTDVFYQLSARILMLRIYYQLEDYDSMAYQINAFRHFLGRNKEIEKDKRNQYLQYLSWLKKVARLAEQRHLEDQSKWLSRQQKLQNDFVAAAPMVQRSWLEKELRQSFS